MNDRVLELKKIFGERAAVATQVADLWTTWNNQRAPWLAQTRELRNYVMATDTTTTSNSSDGWGNKTTLPKLCQLRDNLHANYLSGLTPNDDYIRWESYSPNPEDLAKKEAIQAYMSNKMRESGVRDVLSQLLYDYIDYGNAFVDVEWVAEEHVDANGETIPGYIGPRLVRISPEDIVFNPMASSFNNTPKIVRTIRTIGDIAKQAGLVNAPKYIVEAYKILNENRKKVRGFGPSDFEKAYGFAVDGFGSLSQYFASGVVEFLELEGDFYDVDTGTVYPNHVITVMDRMYVLRADPIPSWLGSTKRHVAWRKRPDNLWGMGPLDNLVGMQYRIDHLENLKADIFDMIAAPPMVIKGDVSEFNWAPNEKIFVGEDGSFDLVKLDTAALNADMQIQFLQQQMEEFAGAPREAMGIRSPGEKTMYEVQQLITAAGRIFQEKLTTFEINLLEPALNDALEISRRSMDGGDVVRVIDDDLGIVAFMSISKDDITAKGKLRPIGARHFSAKAQMMQNLLGVVNSPLWGEIRNHFSKYGLAKTVEDAFQVARLELVQKDIGLYEEAETQRTLATLQQQLAEEDAMSNIGA